MKKQHLAALQKVYLCLIFSFLYVPIAVMIVFSFNESKSRTLFTGFTFKWYQSLFHNEMILDALWLSLAVAFLAATVATVLGVMASIGISGMKKRTQGVINTVSYLPVVNPEIITGVSLMMLFVVYVNIAHWLNSNPAVPDFLKFLPENVFGFGTLLIAHITFCVPYVIFNVAPKLRRMDVRMYEAALDLGCNPRQAFFKVVLPELMPAILSAFLISLTYSIDDFIISYFSCGTLQTLPIAIYSMTRKKVSPEINALSTIMFVVILCIILISNALESHSYRKKRIKE